ncbi:MAG: S-methyl-5-thioribose-1-phosphate isomerase [Burkholderiaceae bacterium]
MNVGTTHYRSIWPIGDDAVGVIDQTRLPHAFATQTLTSSGDVLAAIKTMVVRGAPLIGAAGAYGLALAMREDASDANLTLAHERLNAARPTAVNLRWALDRMKGVLAPLPPGQRSRAAWLEAARIADEDVALNQSIGRHAADLLRAIHTDVKRPLQVLTHCNAGWLATVDYGTALSGLYQAHDSGVPLHVWVDETRPRNQGLLTAWELAAHGVPHTLIVDSAGGHLMQRGDVDLVLVGADRVSARGDVANKIGTYMKALAARDNKLPFYVAVPSPTIDWLLRDEMNVPIEERSVDEVSRLTGIAADGGVTSVRIVDQGTAVANPAFDITPARLVTGIITERGIAAPADLAALFPESRRAA